ncbi:hypothetical protein ESA_03279 [Cronobacter sakazakii ATCC BAA-894]|uniref:Uncharacterized protein n=1 Tax=Cronobacter sakazakii (strain ATCC BAA-894) TaxID=290339 RepID=A7MIB8_CROS8|nr:hypothetical protein ESA_03279 [Cronobacter sakazakii ATCC BAA-894]
MHLARKPGKRRATGRGLLPVIRFRAVFAQIMFIQQRLLHWRQFRGELAAEDPHIGDLFQHDRVMHRVDRIFTPGERAVGVHQHAGHLSRIDIALAEGFGDHHAGFPLIRAVDLVIRHFTGAGDLPVEVIGMRGAGRRDRQSRLRPDRRVARMGMHNAADRRKLLIEQAMGGRIGRRLFRAFDDFAGLDADHHHIFCGHHAVIDARGLDNKQAALAVNGAHVAPRERHQIMLWQRQIGFQHLTLEFF